MSLFAFALDAIRALFMRAIRQDEASRRDAAAARRARVEAARARDFADVLDEWDAPRKPRPLDRRPCCGAPEGLPCDCGTSEGAHRDWCRAPTVSGFDTTEGADEERARVEARIRALGIVP